MMLFVAKVALMATVTNMPTWGATEIVMKRCPCAGMPPYYALIGVVWYCYCFLRDGTSGLYSIAGL